MRFFRRRNPIATPSPDFFFVFHKTKQKREKNQNQRPTSHPNQRQNIGAVLKSLTQSKEQSRKTKCICDCSYTFSDIARLDQNHFSHHQRSTTYFFFYHSSRFDFDRSETKKLKKPKRNTRQRIFKTTRKTFFCKDARKDGYHDITASADDDSLKDHDDLDDRNWN